MSKQKGFTLIELVVVMVILGIIAAFAIPKYYDFTTQANIADLNGLAGAINSANVTAHGAALALSQTGGNITMEGTSVALAFGYPTGLGIINAVNVSSAFSTTGSTATAATFTLRPNCTVVYTAATSLTTPPTVVLNTTGC